MNKVPRAQAPHPRQSSRDANTWRALAAGHGLELSWAPWEERSLAHPAVQAVRKTLPRKKIYVYIKLPLFISSPSQIVLNSEWGRLSRCLSGVYSLSGLRDSARTSAFQCCMCSIPSSGWWNTPPWKGFLKADSWALSSWGKDHIGANISAPQMVAFLLLHRDIWQIRSEKYKSYFFPLFPQFLIKILILFSLPH